MELEGVFLRIHLRACHFVLRHTSPRSRAVFTYSLLCSALVSVAFVAYLHVSYVGQNYCLAEELERQAPAGRAGVDWDVLLIEVETAYDRAHALEEAHRRKMREPSESPNHLANSLSGVTEARSAEGGHSLGGKGMGTVSSREKTTVTRGDRPSRNRVSSTHDDVGFGSLSASIFGYSGGEDGGLMGDATSEEVHIAASEADEIGMHKDDSDSHVFSRWDDVYDVYAYEKAQFEFAVERGILLLSDEARSRHNVTVTNVTIRSDHTCLGTGLFGVLLEEFVGYDTILLNALVRQHGGKGYLFDMRMFEIYSLWHALPTSVLLAEELGEDQRGLVSHLEVLIFDKIGILLLALTLYICTTALVSLSLRETQRVIINHLQATMARLRQGGANIHTRRLALIQGMLMKSMVFVLILLGILYILSDIFADSVLALLTIVIAWGVELFSLLSVRTRTSMVFFGRIYGCLSLIYYIYILKFPLGFTYATVQALLGYYMLLQCMCCYIFLYVEMPAHHRWSPTEPREGLQIRPVVMRIHNHGRRRRRRRPPPPVAAAPSLHPTEGGSTAETGPGGVLGTDGSVGVDGGTDA